MRDDVKKARIVITNYHAFIAARARRPLERRARPAPGTCRSESDTLETEGKCSQRRSCQNLWDERASLVLTMRPHHCYREKPKAEDEEARGISRERTSNS